MLDHFFEMLEAPDTARVEKKIHKKLFHEYMELGITDRKAFRDDLDTIICHYALKPKTLAVPPYADEEREYLEIPLVAAYLKTGKRSTRIAEIIHRAIPYPVLLLLVHDDALSINLAHKRFSQAEYGAFVAEAFYNSDFIHMNAPTEVEDAFLKSIAFSRLPHTHLYDFYGGMIQRVVALKCARLTGAYDLPKNGTAFENRRLTLDKVLDLQRRISELRALFKKADHFSEKTELNVQIKALEKEAEQLKLRL